MKSALVLVSNGNGEPNILLVQQGMSKLIHEGKTLFLVDAIWDHSSLSF